MNEVEFGSFSILIFLHFERNFWSQQKVKSLELPDGHKLPVHHTLKSSSVNYSLFQHS